MELPNSEAAAMGTMVERASAHVLGLLLGALPPTLVYHDATHTRDVAAAARRIGGGEGLRGEELEMVLLAAWFHDVGYTEVYAGHEEKGAAMAARFLRGEGYPEGGIAGVCGCIMATRMPQRPTCLMEEVLCDADLSHLAGEDFTARNDLLRREWELALGKRFTDREWIMNTVEFLAGTRYHTRFAREELGEGVAANLRAQRRMLEGE